MTTESYTFGELDELCGAMLHLGGLHATLGQVLDATHYRRDLLLIEFINHAPAGIVHELLPATVMIIDEVVKRLDGVRGAISSAMDTQAELAGAVESRPEVREAFDSMMTKLFGDEPQKDGLS